MGLAPNSISIWSELSFSVWSIHTSSTHTHLDPISHRILTRFLSNFNNPESDLLVSLYLFQTLNLPGSSVRALWVSKRQSLSKNPCKTLFRSSIFHPFF
ncbi:hypothetical protein NC652_003965 [Populus alba x Populus x berolinensis]|uniref:Uncharacterized protein n=1 Tax=Populus alba x Populus x berolinensis TaxID=444605 RepID=A0AAD6RSV3_9ROSI|nr:hypothetical protein NC652_003965 [Populus alba x Populus x berolinensis]KAJ7014533.1 hypothetical protein NC653_003985 [Populus alba x Populus x berolinensis]